MDKNERDGYRGFSEEWVVIECSNVIMRTWSVLVPSVYCLHAFLILLFESVFCPN